MTNDLLYTVSIDPTISYIWYIWNIDGKLIDKINFKIRPNNSQADKIVFSNDLTKAVADPSTQDELVLLDSTLFRDWLEEQGLLFHPAKGIIKENHLRIRENPNLSKNCG